MINSLFKKKVYEWPYFQMLVYEWSKFSDTHVKMLKSSIGMGWFFFKGQVYDKPSFYKESTVYDVGV